MRLRYVQFDLMYRRYFISDPSVVYFSLLAHTVLESFTSPDLDNNTIILNGKEEENRRKGEQYKYICRRKN